MSINTTKTGHRTKPVTPREATATNYVGESAKRLAFGFFALMIAGFFLQAGHTSRLVDDDPAALFTIGIFIGLVGTLLTAEGIHRLATNLDRALRKRLS